MEGTQMGKCTWEILTEISDLVAEMKKKYEESQEARPQDGATLPLERPELEPMRVKVLTSLNALQEAHLILQDLDCPVEIPWLGEKVLNMEYHSGSSPWNFCLRYSSADKTLSEIHEALKEKFDGGQLKEVRNALKEGTFVACHEGKRFFRAIVQKFNPKSGRLRVLKVDLNEEGYVQLSNTYRMPSSIGSIPCQTVRCVLNVGDPHMRNVWLKHVSGLETIFKKALTEYSLDVKVTCKLKETCPPEFLVNIYAYNEDLMTTKSIGKWFNDTLLAKLKGIASDEDDVMTYLDEDCFDPFYQSEENPIPPPVLTNGDAFHEASGHSDRYVPSNSRPVSVDETDQEPKEEIKKELPSDELIDEPHPELIDEARAKVSNWIENYSDEYSIKANRKIPPPTVEPKIEEPSFFPRKVKTGKTSQGFSVCENGNSAKQSPLRDSGARSNYSKKSSEASVVREQGFSLSKKAEPTKVSPHSVNQRTNASDNRMSGGMSPLAPEFFPSCRVEITQNGDDDMLDVVANLNEEYQPQDEKRMCVLLQKKGFCNRPGCSKDHQPRTTAWTRDMEPVHQEAFNNIALPQERSETFLRVEHVVDGNTFYATIPEHYSDINEEGKRETLAMLQGDLNSSDNSSSHPYLETLPAISQLVLAQGLQRSLGPKKKWLRARIIEILDENTVEVFFCDFGNKEVVATRDLRKIRDQFLHLPLQAVRTKLDSVKPADGKENEAKKYLERHIKGHMLKAKIMSRNVPDAELDVILFDATNKSINNKVCALHLCYPLSL